MAVDTLPTFENGHVPMDLGELKSKAVVSSTELISSENTQLPVKDPRINDAPQLEAKSEWYYFQSHLTSTISEDPHHTIIVCIFRNSPEDSTEDHSWAVIYAILDWRTQKYTTYSKVTPMVPENAAKFLKGRHTMLSQTIQGLIDSVPKSEQGGPFEPDALFTKPVTIRQSADGEGPAIQLDWDDGAFLVGENGTYHLKVPEIELDIHVQATRPMMLHGNDGVTLKDERVSTVSATLASYELTVCSMRCSTTVGRAQKSGESTRETRYSVQLG